MQFTLDPSIDAPGLKRAYARRGAVSIKPFLPDEQAERLRAHLLERSDWHGRLRDLDGRLFDLPSEQMAEWGEAKLDGVRRLVAPRSGQKGFGYAHARIRIVDEEGILRDGQSMLGRFGQFMMSETVLELFRTVTGVPGINFADSFAARYDPGDYTTMHDDGINERKSAYVFGLTRTWRSDWGGLLLFHGANGDVERGLAPDFNVFNIFSVPRQHSVSVVAPFATEPRLTITGWFHQLSAHETETSGTSRQTQEQRCD
ncbi:MAG: 2OG-Fe(II) oxygenase [Sphingomonas sp.]|nr:2OG-Fe(II) oxygenase [Sphingomonas sp.]